MMRQIISKLCLYGILSAFYTSILCFGDFYPQYGIPEGTVVYQEAEESISDETSFFSKKKLADEKTEIICRSYFLEKIKSLKNRNCRWENRYESR